ncbi:unnamed protein product [Prorocentrum cordatum]|uniref:Uncharacterized protein n=1 Tax=Prorocentrum cordatum TaxID=2364126 RepID=A0ABN9SBJ0_9DINO|nr:unnamed protein product [Polarella glacialis]
MAAWEVAAPWEDQRVHDSREEGAEIFADYIVQLKNEKVLSAKQACLLAHWATKAGVVGFVNELAMEPTENRQSGHWTRHWDTVMRSRASDEHYLDMNVPMSNRSDLSRVMVDMPTTPPHVAVHEEAENAPDIKQRLQDAIDLGILPPVYAEHPVVTGAPNGVPVFPLAVYTDGVAFTRTDSVIGFYVYNIVTRVRHLCATIRKSDACKCGCRMWCTIYGVLSMLKWSFLSMQNGRWPDARPDGSAWGPSDEGEASCAGTQFGWRAVLLFLKADWSENVGTMAFASWQSTDCPCPKCDCTRDTWDNFLGVSPMGAPWSTLTVDDYDAECRACEYDRVVTDADFPRLRGNLFFDKREQGNRGRCLERDFDTLGLKKGDRMEPWPELPTTNDFDIRPKPLHVRFWRRSNERHARHRNPLICNELYTSPSHLVEDWLHCFSLGVFQFYNIGWLIHTIIEENCFRMPGTTQPEIAHGTVQLTKSRTMAWYGQEDRAGRQRNRIQDLTVGMLNTKSEGISLHGGETNDFLVFCAEVLVHEVRDPLPDFETAKDCGNALCNMLSLFRRSDKKWGIPEAQDRWAQ